jgi:hypoxanthine phosphoribosyltransferase
MNREEKELLEEARKEGNLELESSLLKLDQDKKSLDTLGRKALSKRDARSLFIAMDCFRASGNLEGLRETSDLAMRDGIYSVAEACFKELNDRKNLIKIIRELDGNKTEFYLFSCSIIDYLGEDTTRRIIKQGRKWTKEQGYPEDNYAFEAQNINLAHLLSKEFDYGVGIAKGGLTLAHAFSLFGLPLKIVEAHKRGSSTTFDLKKNAFSDLEEKRVLVIDQDVQTGATSERVLEEIQKYNPEEVSLALRLNPRKIGEISIGSNAENIPREFSSVYFPYSFNYSSFDKAVEKVEENLGVNDNGK